MSQEFITFFAISGWLILSFMAGGAFQRRMAFMMKMQTINEVKNSVVEVIRFFKGEGEKDAKSNSNRKRSTSRTNRTATSNKSVKKRTGGTSKRTGSEGAGGVRKSAVKTTKRAGTKSGTSKRRSPEKKEAGTAK